LAPAGYIDTDDLERLTLDMTKANVLTILGQPAHYDDWSAAGDTRRYSGRFSYKGIFKEDDKRWFREHYEREPDRAYFHLSVYFNAEGKVCEKSCDGILLEPTALERIRALLRGHVEP
jgi:hypothetical protein